MKILQENGGNAGTAVLKHVKNFQKTATNAAKAMKTAAQKTRTTMEYQIQRENVSVQQANVVNIKHQIKVMHIHVYGKNVKEIRIVRADSVVIETQICPSLIKVMVGVLGGFTRVSICVILFCRNLKKLNQKVSST